METFEILSIVIGILLALIFGGRTAYEGIMNSFFRETKLTEKTVGSTADSATYKGKKITGQVESVNDIDDEWIEIKVFGSEEVERCRKSMLVCERKDKALAHSPHDVWINLEAYEGAPFVAQLVYERNDALAKASMKELELLKLRKDQKEAVTDNWKQTEKAAKHVRHIKGGDGMYSPFGFGGYRRPYSSYLGGMSSYGGQQQQQQGDDDND